MAIIIESIKLNATRLLASSSDLGSIIASSYRVVAIIPNRVDSIMKTARIEKSSGVYILERMGEIKSGIACAKAVPVIKVATFLKNSDLIYFLII